MRGGIVRKRWISKKSRYRTKQHKQPASSCDRSRVSPPRAAYRLCEATDMGKMRLMRSDKLTVTAELSNCPKQQAAASGPVRAVSSAFVKAMCVQMVRDGAWLSAKELVSVFEHRRRSERPMKATLEALAVDLAVVSEGVRSGYLFDSVSLTSDEALELSRRAGASGGATAMLQVRGSTDEQTQWFFINLAIVPDRLRQRNYPVWVELMDSAIRVLTEPPTGLALLLQDLLIQLQTPCAFLTVRSQAGAEVLCPFAAFLIEYPYAYIPSTAVSLDFGGSLVAVELTLSGYSSEQSLMKFSYPGLLDGPKATANVQRLVSTVSTRLQGARWSFISSYSHTVPATGIVL